MKQSSKKKHQRKIQALLSLLLYRTVHGNIETESLSVPVSQIYDEIIKTNSQDIGLLNNTTDRVFLEKLPKTTKQKQKLIDHLKTYQQYEKGIKSVSNENPLTISQMVNGWAGITGQDETELLGRVSPLINKLIKKQCERNGYLCLTDDETYANPQSVADYIIDLVNVLIDTTPPEKQANFSEQLKSVLLTTTQNGSEIDHRVLQDASMMFVSETVTQTNEILSRNPIAKDRLSNPIFNQVVTNDARKYGWDCHLPTHNDELYSALSKHGVTTNRWLINRALKKLGRKNVMQTIDDTLGGILQENLENIINQQLADDQIQTQSVWEFNTVSPEENKEIGNAIREWLFRSVKI